MSTALLSPELTLVPERFRVVERRQETVDTWTLVLDGDQPFAARPGQFTMLYAFGVGEVPISISGDLAEPGRLVHTVRAVGQTTRAIVAADVLGVRGPFGAAWPVEEVEGADLVIVAGGIGLAPLRPALYHALRHRHRYERVVLLYGGRTPQELLFKDELVGWQSTRALEVAVTVDAAPAPWAGRVGLVTKLVPAAGFDPASAVAMVCGPEVMMRFAAQALEEGGVPAERIWVSLERNMQCGVGLCGHCQLGPKLICRDGPVFRLDDVRALMEVREL